MTISLVPATADDMAGIRDFNQRLHSANAGYELPESARTLGFARDDGFPVWHEVFVAKEESTIRGGYALKRELLSLEGRGPIEIRNYQIPLSEGIVNRAYATVGIQLLQDAMIRHTHLYSLGMGSLQRPLPRLLSRFSWSVEPVPFYFRVIHASRFLKNIKYLTDRKFAGFLMRLTRYSGVGAIATWGWRLTARLKAPRTPLGIKVESVTSFGSEADTVFAQAQSAYPAIIDRTAAALKARFPQGDPRLIRIVARSGSKPLGWLVLTCTSLRSHKQFGSMRLGCIVDGLCAPDLSTTLVQLGTQRLIAENVDLIVSNQTHSAWTSALRCSGFLNGPSNFLFARSPALMASTPPLPEWHLNRGDGDGPINL